MSNKNDRPLSEIFVKFADYYNLKHQYLKGNPKPLKDWEPLYRVQMGRFLFLVNGKEEEVTDPETKMTIPGFNMTIFYNGWLHAVVSPFEGTVLCNSRGDSIEPYIIKVLDKHIRKLKQKLN